MASHKEEPNTSSLFGDSTGDDPFSQLQQQHPVSEPAAKKDQIQDKQPAVTAQEQQPKAVVGDASSLFGNSGDGNADLFFSSTNATANAVPQSAHPPLATNASAASFFDQPQQATNSFFDDFGQHSATNLTQSYSQESQQHSTNPASNLTQAYDPNTYNSYDYSQQQSQGQVAEQQECDQSQWIQFDPNQHYYYDDQGQVHYYDPNTNQEYDMSQYGYDQQGQTYDYQYDPQYADYYAQQGYDPNAYAATEATGTGNTGVADVQHQQAYAPVQDNYDPNAYAPATATPQPSQPATATVPLTATAASDQDYYNPSSYATEPSNQVQHQQDYQPQSYAPTTNAVAEVPAQVQSEQTIDTQHYTAEQQDPYGMQNYAPVDTSADTDQQADYNYQSYDPNTIATTVTTNDNVATEFQQGHFGQDAYAPVDFNDTNYSQIQADFEAEDLQQSQAPPPSRDVGPPPSGPPKSVLSPPPPSLQTNTPPAALTFHRDSIDVNDVPELSEQHKEHEAPQEDLNDLDDLVLGGSNSQQHDPVPDSIDRLTAAADDYDTQKTTDDSDQATKHSEDANVGCSTEDQQVPQSEIKTEPTVFASVLSAAESPENKDKKTSDFVVEESPIKDQKPAASTQDESYFPQQSSEDHKPISSAHVPDQNEQAISYEPDQSATYDFNYGNEPSTQSAEPDQVVGFEAQPVTGYEPTNSHEPQHASAYEPEQAASYEPTSNYEPTTSYEPTSSYEPQQNDSYSSHHQSSNYEPQQASAYEPTAYEPQSTNAYDPASTSVTAGGYEPQQYGRYEPTAPPTHSSAPPAAVERNMTSPPPPPRAGSIKSVASPPPPMQSYYPQRANSITEPDRRHHSSSPFAGNYGNNNGMNSQYPMMERSATVPPPMTERMASPRPQLIPCPDRLCEGENKPKAKFCCECGRPLAGISRSTTPSAISPSAYNASMEGFSPMSTAVFGAVAEPVQRTALDDKKDEMIASLKQFVDSSIVIQSDLDDQEKRRRAIAYIDSRLQSFDESKALLWRVVKSMMEHSESVLGDGGELDTSIIALVSSASKDSDKNTSDGHLDQLEAFLTKGDREGACQFANDHDMWAHSLIIASSVKDENNDLFKKTVTQFIQRELFSPDTELVPQVPGDKKSLRMLYSVFNGAGADAVSEYVKTSTDAEAVYTDETLQGWQFALSLILANRSADDQAAIQGLGDQLKRLSKNNEARLCYLLSPDVSGLDNSKMIGDDLYTDLDALYLVELYEFASKASIQQDSKLMLAWWLTDLGFTEASQKYIDAISAKVETSGLDKLKQMGDISPAPQSENVTSLLNKQSFDALIGSIDAKVTSITSFGNNGNYATTSYGFNSQDYNNTQAHDYTGQETAADSLQQDAYNYGYGYGGSYTESADATVPPVAAIPAAVTSPFGKPKGIQSPFGIQNTAAAAAAATAVTSPFGQVAPVATDNNGTWWGASDTNQIEDQQTSYQPYQPETNANTSYQPDAYTPAAATATTPAAESTTWDDDDDLGFGNSKPKKKQDRDADTKTTDSKTQEKPNEIDNKKEKEHTEKASGGGWGIFNLFGRKEKDPNTEEKKAVKANLGEESSFYYDEKEKRWVNKLNDTKPAAATPPPPPKAATPQPPASKPMVPPPVAGLKPSSMPPPRINSAPNVPSMSGNGGLPNAAPPPFNTPQAGRRAAGGGRKSVRSRYVDVLSADQK